MTRRQIPGSAVQGGVRSEREWMILLLCLFGGPALFLILGVSCQERGPTQAPRQLTPAARPAVTLQDSLSLS